MDVQAEVSRYVEAQVRAVNAQLESDCAIAMQLQDFDYLDRLVVIHDGMTRSVASRWNHP